MVTKAQVRNCLIDVAVILFFVMGHIIHFFTTKQLFRIMSLLSILFVAGCSSQPRRIDPSAGFVEEDRTALTRANLREEDIREVGELLEKQDERIRIIELKNHSHRSYPMPVTPIPKTEVKEPSNPKGTSTPYPWDDDG